LQTLGFAIIQTLSEKNSHTTCFERNVSLTGRTNSIVRLEEFKQKNRTRKTFAQEKIPWIFNFRTLLSCIFPFSGRAIF